MNKCVKSALACTVLLLLVPALAAAQDSASSRPEPTRKVVYKRVGDVQLQLHIFEPDGHTSDDRRAAIVFFFGGGWKGGSPSQFYPHAAHLAEKGMVAMCAEYRVQSRHKTSPFECVKDGKSALRWVRQHADELGVDPGRIAAGGGSAGGHVATAVATVPGLNEEGESTDVSERPAALVLFNPVYDNGPGGYGYERVGERYREISPLHNIHKGMPPAIVFLGTEDKLIPVETAKRFQKRMQDAGSRSELMLFEGEPHGFFNYGRGDGANYRKTVAAMDAFLKSLGYFEPSSATPE